MALVTFTTWVNTIARGTDAKGVPVSVNPHEVIEVIDFCGDQLPGQQITLTNKKTHLVQGEHFAVVEAIEAGRKA